MKAVSDPPGAARELKGGSLALLAPLLLHVPRRLSGPGAAKEDAVQ